jgi:ankyrin repeat protein
MLPNATPIARALSTRVCMSMVPLWINNEVEHFLHEDASNIHKRGAHHIPLLVHAALSGDMGLMEMLYQRGATEGAAFALNVAAEGDNLELARWLLTNAAPDLAWQNWRGKRALDVATDNGNVALVELLKMHGAQG